MRRSLLNWCILVTALVVVVGLGLWPAPVVGSARPVVVADPGAARVAGAGGRYLVLVVSDRSVLQELAARAQVAPVPLSSRWQPPAADPRRSSSDAVWTAEDAWVAAQRLLGRRVAVEDYLTVLAVQPRSAFARAGIRVDDRIVAVDGAPMSAAAFYLNVLEDDRQAVRLTVTHGSTARQLWLPAGRRGRRDGLVVEGHAVARDRHRQALIPQDEEGPSSGLMTALALVDASSAGSLSAGRVVAGTGAIDDAGRVWPVGSVAAKARGAEAAGAELLIVPQGAGAQARRAVGGAIPVHEVSTLREAVALLCHAGGRGAACRAATRTRRAARAGA